MSRPRPWPPIDVARRYLEGQRRKNEPQKHQVAKKVEDEPREATPEERALLEQLARPAFTEVPLSTEALGSGKRTGGGWTWEVTRG